MFDPATYHVRQPLHYLAPEKNLVCVSHVQHVDHPTQVRATALPPSLMRVSHQHVFGMDSLVLMQLFELKAIEKRLVYAVRNPASERCGVVVLLDLPHGDGIHSTRETPVNASCKRSERRTVPRKCRQLSWVIIHWQTVRTSLDQHVNDAG